MALRCARGSGWASGTISSPRERRCSGMQWSGGALWGAQHRRDVALRDAVDGHGGVGIFSSLPDSVLQL